MDYIHKRVRRFLKIVVPLIGAMASANLLPALIYDWRLKSSLTQLEIDFLVPAILCRKIQKQCDIEPLLNLIERHEKHK